LWRRDERYTDGARCVPSQHDESGGCNCLDATGDDCVPSFLGVSWFSTNSYQIPLPLTVSSSDNLAAKCLYEAEKNADCGDFFFIKEPDACVCVRSGKHCASVTRDQGDYKIFTKQTSGAVVTNSGTCG
jgi:hypothetical protein